MKRTILAGLDMRRGQIGVALGLAMVLLVVLQVGANDSFPSPDPDQTPASSAMQRVFLPVVAHAEPFNIHNTSAPVTEFIRSMATAGIELTQQQVVEHLTIKQLKAKDGHPVAVAIYALDPDPSIKGEALEGTVPLMMAGEGWEWRPIALRDLAEALSMTVGTHFSSDQYPYAKLPQINRLVTTEFNGAHIDQLTWNITEPQEGVFVFDLVDGMYEKSPDAVVDKALTSGMYLSGYLVNPPSNFTYSYLKDMTGLTRSRLLGIMENHIRTTVERYKGKISVYSVVNESRTPEDRLPDGRPYDNFYTIIGDDYIETAFSVAREADPRALLLYNETRNETMSRRLYPRTKQIVDRLKPLGLIDGVGVQMHLDGPRPPTKQDVIDAFLSYGVPVFITELDVNMSEVAGGPQERLRTQAEIFGEAVSACLESRVCPQIWFWDAFDKYSWLDSARGGNALADPTMFDDNLNKKPAYYAVLQAFLEIMPR